MPNPLQFAILRSVTGPASPPPAPEPSAAGPNPKQRAVLSRELSEFLIELSIALHKRAIYPAGHPSLAPAATRVVQRAQALLQDRPTFSLGVARNQLVIEGVATDPKNPVLAELAARLHRHQLGAMTFSRGLEVGEVVDVLGTVAVEADRTGQPLGLGSRALLEAWPHIKLHSLSYERLSLLEGRGETAPEVEATTEERVRGARLWIGLARAALAGQISEDEEPPTAPAALAQAIDDHSPGGGYEQVIVGYLLQIAEELKTAGGEEAVALRRQMSRLFAGMQPETLKRLCEMGGDAVQRRKFALDTTSGMAVDAVLEVVQAVAAASKQSISHSLMRMLSKLAANAERGAPGARPLADAALRDQVRGILSGWKLDDPTPGAYGAALQRMSRSSPLFVAPAEQKHLPEPERVVQMSLEVDAVGPNVWRACAQLVDTGRLGVLLDMLESVPDQTESSRALWERAASPDTLRWVLATVPVDFAMVDRLLPRLGERAADPLLDTLAEAEARATRRAVLERLVRMGSVLGPGITARLADDRWYVQRNLLALLDEMPELPVGFSALQWSKHPDARVRLEAFKISLKSSPDRDAVIVAALADTEQRLVRMALIAAQRVVPAEAVPRVIALVNDAHIPQDLRLQGIRVLGANGSPEALKVLLGLTDRGRTLFGRRKLAPKSPEFLVALAALARGWGRESRVMAVLARAAVSGDPDIRAATDPDGHRG